MEKANQGVNHSPRTYYANIVIVLVFSCIVTSLLFSPSSHSALGSNEFYNGIYKEFASQGQISITYSEDLYHISFTPTPTEKGHGYGGFALQREYKVKPKTYFEVTLRVDQAEAGPAKKIRAKFLVHVKCSDGEIWEICVEAAIWNNYCEEDFFDGVRNYRLDASSPPIIYLGYDHEPDEYVKGNYNVQDLFKEYQGNVEPLTITEVVFEAWTNSVQAFSDGESIDAYFKTGNIGEQNS
jgi:hypothetical protein